ncbi:hypothetical protein BZA05DRAFT_424607 [Tricharina praecox]|uniref:uncharacterized protein n=1 Tax=Tricharina praecox TaxID=43433 RepID=UPI00221FAB8C|nr:uncharacterized protein BZA05DRAFT_424607 [Tricharina praecox]KAI5855349.1 hypothetical protein BZA05DRAFT_424607 [Tricharina praecox]
MLRRTLIRLTPFRPRTRNYATVDTSDPYRWPTHTHPTPYDILEIPPKGVYTKTRYLELIKLYHPDHRHHHLRSHTSHLERFRLTVTAHRLLCDPSRRAAYDRYGAGWHHAPPGALGSQPLTPESAKWWQQREGHSPFASEFAHAYGRGGPDDTAANGNWEDWERWRAARDHPPQKPLLTNNGAFVTIVVILACVGSLAELNYVGGKSEQAVEMGEKRSVMLGQDLARRRREAGVDGREERVRRFLIMRDPKPLDTPPPPVRKGRGGDG